LILLINALCASLTSSTSVPSILLSEHTTADFSAVGDAWVSTLSDGINKGASIVRLFNIIQLCSIKSLFALCILQVSSVKKLTNIITTGNQMGWFTDDDGQPTKFHVLELLCDVKSYWNSIDYTIN